MAHARALQDALQQKQKALGESDARFARRLGIDREMWRKVKAGKSEPGTQTIRGALGAFPDLASLVVAFFLPVDETKVSDSEAIVAS